VDIEAVAKIVSIEEEGFSRVISFELPANFRHILSRRVLSLLKAVRLRLGVDASPSQSPTRTQASSELLLLK